MPDIFFVCVGVKSEELIRLGLLWRTVCVSANLRDAQNA